MTDRQALRVLLVGIALVLIVGECAVQIVAAQDSLDHVRVYRSTTQSIANATWTVVVFNSVVYPSVGQFDTGTGIFTASTSGWHHVCAGVRFAPCNIVQAGDVFTLRLVPSGDYIKELPRVVGVDDYGGSITIIVAGCGTVYLGQGDTVQVQVYQSSGAALNLDPASEGAIWLTVDELVTAIPFTPTPYTPVPTYTPTNTPTPTRTPTATPDPLVITNTLSSGNTWELRREVSYGNASVVLGLIVLAGLDVLMLVSRVVRG